jgi:hypothetical protein
MTHDAWLAGGPFSISSVTSCAFALPFTNQVKLSSVVAFLPAGPYKGERLGHPQQLHQQLGAPQHTHRPGHPQRSSKPPAGPALFD